MTHLSGHVDEIKAPVVPVQPGITSGVSGFSAPTIPDQITGSDLVSKPDLGFQQPSPTPTLSASSADATLPEAKATKQETEVSDLIKSITDIQNKNLGRTAFEAEQRTTQGIPELETAQTDIANQILMLQAQEKNVEAEMQKRAEGRGITKGGLAPLTAAAKYDLGIQANVLSAQLAASQNKLALADRRVKLAVEAKFGPQEEEMKAKLANLELLLKDPSLTLAEKNRANAQSLILKQKEAEIAKAKQETTDIWNVSTTAAQNIQGFKPTAQYATSAQALGAIQNAKTKEEALRIATETGLTKQPTGAGDIAEFKSFFPNVDITTPSGQQQYLNWKAKVTAAGRKPEDADLAGKPGRSLDQLNFLETTVNTALGLKHAAGRSPVKEFAARTIFGATDKTRLEALTNTLRTNVLTLMTDPDIKKFFGPQMSEADVRLMTAGGTTLNPDLQSPKDMEEELLRLQDLFAKIKASLPQSQGQINSDDPLGIRDLLLRPSQTTP